MRKLIVSTILIVLLLVEGLALDMAMATERGRPIRIGVLTPSWGSPPQVIGLRDGLLKLGYKENEDFVLGVRFTQGNLTALTKAADQLVQYGVDLIFTHRNDAAKAAQKATTQTPIVFTGVNDPIGLNLIQSFARPGGNITGVTDQDINLGPKRLELFREMLPRLRRVLYLYDVHDVFSVAAGKVYREAARHLGIVLVERSVRTEEEAQSMLAKIRQSKVDGILRPASSLFEYSRFHPGGCHSAEDSDDDEYCILGGERVPRRLRGR
ncbi:MAG: ABC transporter substrate-binding protein [bacterium]|nr:ABC transporter substrate-binding protein [bacterium]